MVDIVIVNWNSGNYLQLCINSIFSNNNQKYVGKVFIVDNNSTDESLKKIPVSDKIIIIKNKENYGFAKACNQGFQNSTSSCILLLNPDAKLYSTTLSDCINFMNCHIEVDILGCQLLDDAGSITRSCSRFPTLRGFFYDAIGLSKIAPKIFTPALLMTDWDHKSSRPVNQVMGAFMFIRKSIFTEIGYFDERFFVYYEELDFSKKLAEYGGITYFNADIKAVHSGGGTTSDIKAFRLFLNLRSRLLYGRKHFSYMSYLFLTFCTFIIEPVTRSLFFLSKGNLRGIREVIQG
ncbi:MAG: glycosyltransferase family 2 protein, partial [Ginsengibacter sp.]